MEAFLKETSEIFSGMGLLADPNPAHRAFNLPDDPEELRQMKDEVIRRTIDDIPAIRKQLKEEFKALLKVTDPTPMTTRLVAISDKRSTAKKGPEE